MGKQLFVSSVRSLFHFVGFELIRVLALGKVGFNSLRRRA